MKIRAGFVSNSSTTSFVAYGISVDNDTMNKYLQKLHPLKSEEYGRDIYDLIDDLCESNYLDWSFNADWGMIYVGLELESMDENETKKQFKNRVKEKIAVVFGEELAETCGSIEVSWRDG
jgi:hypothetical protein